MANSKEKSLFNCSVINPQGREELVGKRFLVVSQTSPKPKLSRIGDWHWKAGVIRCTSHVDIKDPELQVRLCFYLFFFYNVFLVMINNRSDT